MLEVVEPLARAARAAGVVQGQAGGAGELDEGEPYRLHALTLEPGCAAAFGAAANGALWPLLHDVGVAPRYAEAAWSGYVEANHRFAERAIAVAERRGHEAPVFFLQDYHLLLVSELLRRRFPRATIAQFLHVPWPAPEVLAASPWAAPICAGLGGNDLVGLNSERWAGHAAASLAPGAALARAGVRVEAFPAGIDAAGLASQAAAPEVTAELERLRAELRAGERAIVVSVDRSDYAKGIAARLAAIRRLLERRAELRGRVVFVQVVSPSRLELPEFAAVAAEARHLTGEINRLYGDAAWQPVRLHAERVPHRQILALYRLADACVVSSLRDGMNLVAKEYVACRGGDDGCLILSRHTGAAERMPEALLVDPTDVGGFADTLADALAGLRDGRCSGLRELLARVLAENVHWWGGAIFARIAGLVQAKSRATKSRQ
jgi:trehalose-6-phosphate synthase